VNDDGRRGVPSDYSILWAEGLSKDIKKLRMMGKVPPRIIFAGRITGENKHYLVEKKVLVRISVRICDNNLGEG